MSKPILIECCGGPGSGKSSLAHGVFSKLKFKNIPTVFYSEEATNVIESLQSDIFQKVPREVLNLKFVSAELTKIYAAKALGAQVIVGDCGLYQNSLFTDQQLPFLEELLERDFHRVIVLVERVKPFIDFKRVTDEQHSNELTKRILAEQQFDIKAPGSEEGVQSITDFVLKTLVLEETL